jgi:hypothetical protein
MGLRARKEVRKASSAMATLAIWVKTRSKACREEGREGVRKGSFC